MHKIAMKIMLVARDIFLLELAWRFVHVMKIIWMPWSSSVIILLKLYSE